MAKPRHSSTSSSRPPAPPLRGSTLTPSVSQATPSNPLIPAWSATSPPAACGDALSANIAPFSAPATAISSKCAEQVQPGPALSRPLKVFEAVPASSQLATDASTLLYAAPSARPMPPQLKRYGMICRSELPNIASGLAGPNVDHVAQMVHKQEGSFSLLRTDAGSRCVMAGITLQLVTQTLYGGGDRLIADVLVCSNVCTPHASMHAHMHTCTHSCPCMYMYMHHTS